MSAGTAETLGQLLCLWRVLLGSGSIDQLQDTLLGQEVCRSLYGA